VATPTAVSEIAKLAISLNMFLTHSYMQSYDKQTNWFVFSMHL